ncbi:hypothetical protein HII31_05419, partial [Pseudocercospora fuligena]
LGRRCLAPQLQSARPLAFTSQHPRPNHIATSTHTDTASGFAAMATSAEELSVPARFINRLASTFDSDVGTDLTVVCGTSRWRVHKTLLCQHSTVFESMLQGALEASRSELELPEDSEVGIEMMLKFMYTFDYIAPNTGVSYTKREESSGDVNDVAVHMKVIRTADKYDMPQLFYAGDVQVWECMRKVYTEHWPDRAREVLVNVALSNIENCYRDCDYLEEFLEFAQTVPKLLADIILAGKVVPRDRNP